MIIQIICVTIRTYGWHLFKTCVPRDGENKLRYNYICARREDLFEAGSATFELSLNDTSSENICIDVRIRRVLRDALPDRSDSGDVNAEDLLAMFVALNVRTYVHTYVHSWPRDLIYLVK